MKTGCDPYIIGKCLNCGNPLDAYDNGKKEFYVCPECMWYCHADNYKDYSRYNKKRAGRK